MYTFLTFIAFTAFVGAYSWYRLKNEKLDSKDGYFLGGRSLTGVVIAGSMLLTNISTEHLIGMNGSSYKNGFIIIAWEVTSALALVLTALYFIPRYLKMGLTTIPEYLEYRYDGLMRTLVAFLLLLSFIFAQLPIVLYTGAINLESIFNISEVLGVSNNEGIWLTVVVVGILGSIYAVFGGLKAVAISDTINGYGLLIGGLSVPIFALMYIGDGNALDGLLTVYHTAPEKFNVIGKKDSVMPFETLFTGLVICQVYYWCMHQVFVQRALGAKNLKEAQKGLLFTGVLKIFIPLVIVLPGVIGYYYFGDSLYDRQDLIYPELVKKVMPTAFLGLFAAVVMGAVLSTFNSVLNSAATIFSNGIYKKHIDKNASEAKLVRVGKVASGTMAIFAILVSPSIGNAPDGLYQLLQQLNGIFVIPIASVLIAGFFIPWVSAKAARVAFFFGFGFYILMTFILEVDIHFVHVWGIEFVLNMVIMMGLSKIYPVDKPFEIKDMGVVELKPWKYAKHLSYFLVIITLTIYVWLGHF
jgi:SSS family solute:Na+ symporter